MLCFFSSYAIGITIAFLISITVCVLTSNTCQRISNRNSSDFQEAQTAQTNIEVDFFSEVDSTGTKITKNGARCQREEPQHWKLPPQILGLHLIEIIALGLLTVHCVFHCHTLAMYLKSSNLKIRQRAMEEQARITAEENARIEKKVEKEVELRMKGKQQGSLH